MTESADLDRMEKDVRQAAGGVGAMILETVLASDNLPAVAVDGVTFAALVQHLRPRLIYMMITTFTAAEDVAVHFDVHEDELDRDLKKLATQWASKDGQSSRLALGLMADGILHGVVETADWFSDFEAEADEVAEARHQEQEDAFTKLQEQERSRREADEKKRLAPLVKKLLADPRFTASKISAAKRLSLAEMVFPDEDRSTLKKAVERAANEIWLAGPSR
ncbi:hypothetical protein [Neorhizobium sp. T6_25]|uniref:hypothetical protein n=1 Tax=Neorhizobium sp. T6_25 TaxID=2093833 RepID=UPI000CFA2901|nr:hypothetical protein [Neorhizobium sp. T6_25]